MFKIIGADQKEYGPVTAEQLRQWIQAGRANAQTRVQAEGGTDWRALGELPEFAEVLATHAASGPLPQVTAPKTSGMAIASLVLGLVGMCGLTAVAGLVLGIVSLCKINRSRGELGGQGLAIAGIAVSAFMLLVSIPLLAGLTLPALAKAKSKAQTVQCVNHVKQLALSAMMYADDHKERLPDAAHWCDLVQTYLGPGSTPVLLCPAGNPSDRCHFAFNAQLSSVELKQVGSPAQTVLFVESGGGWNASGGPELLSGPSRHGRQRVVGFADGHVEVVSSARVNSLRWTP